MISKPNQNDESPFFRNDAADLLRKYHYGIIDNAGNIVLPEFPLADGTPELSGRKAFAAWFHWNQPFQRCSRFVHVVAAKSMIFAPADADWPAIGGAFFPASSCVQWALGSADMLMIVSKAFRNSIVLSHFSRLSSIPWKCPAEALKYYRQLKPGCPLR